VRDAARAFGGSLNDGFVTAVAGGLGRYHAALGIDCPELRMAMPVNLRGDGPDESGNQFAPTQVRVPIQPVGAAERFGAVQATLRAARSEKILSAADAIAAIAAPLPAPVLVAATRTQTQAIDFATSNLRGSSVPVYLAGTKVEANFPFGPRTGCALNITVLSYQGSLDIGINSDPAAITDPELLLACLRIAFDDLVTGAGITL
jgi:diacylglycerol O-acyltransferase